MKIGIIGSGLIVQSVLETLREMKDMQCTALYSRSADKTEVQELAAEFKVKCLYGDIDKFLIDDSYELVYIGLVNSAHYEYAKKALATGKNVFCEKPFTSTYREAKELLELAKENGCFLFESVLPRYSPNYKEIGRHLSCLGDIRMIQCNYSQYSRRYDRYKKGEILPAFNPELSGGSLYDLNVYAVHFMTGLFGKPERIAYFANKGYNGIDTSGVLILDYGDFKAVCCAAKDSESPARCVIQGTKGIIDVKSSPSLVHNVEVVLKDTNVKIDKDSSKYYMENGFSEVAHIMNKKDFEQCYSYMEATLIVMDILEQARKDADIVFAADNKEDKSI